MSYSQFNIYQSSDTDAPALTTTTGSLVNLLNKILVTGYGSKTSAGWELAFTSSTLSSSCYRIPSGSRFYLSVQDEKLSASCEAYTRGFKVASSVLTGSGEFPLSGYQGAIPPDISVTVTTTPGTTGYYSFRKSYAPLDPTAKKWIAFADAYTLYLFVQNGVSSGYFSDPLIFGDIYSYGGTSDVNRCIHISRQHKDFSGIGMWGLTLGPAGVIPEHCMAGTCGQYGYSILVNKMVDYSKFLPGTTGGGLPVGTINGIVAYPNPTDNSLILSPIRIIEKPGYSIRGTLRGIYAVAHNQSYFSHGETFNGSGSFSGKTFMIVGTFHTPVMNSGTAAHVLAVEISETVETN